MLAGLNSFLELTLEEISFSTFHSPLMSLKPAKVDWFSPQYITESPTPTMLPLASTSEPPSDNLGKSLFQGQLINDLYSSPLLCNLTYSLGKNDTKVCKMFHKKYCIELKCMVQWFDIPMHSERITIMKLINISVTVFLFLKDENL